MVILRGLQARPEMNNTFAVLLAAATTDEAQALESKGRVKVSSWPKPLSLKRECVHVATQDEVEAVDWSFADFAFPGDTHNASIKDGVSHALSRFGLVDRCDAFGRPFSVSRPDQRLEK